MIQKVEAIREDVSQWADRFQELIVKTDQDQADAITVLAETKDKMKRIEHWRKFFVDPLNKQVKSINNVFKSQLDPLKVLEGRIKHALKDYADEKEAALLEEAKNASEPVEALKTSVRTDSGLMSRKKIWKWRVKDEAKLRNAYPELFVLDEKAVNAMVKGGAREVEGIEIYQETVIALR